MRMVQKPAGFWIRFLGNVLDGILFLMVGLVLILIFSYESLSLDNFLNGGGETEYYSTISDALHTVYLFVLPILFYGYTLGKRAVGVRIVKMDGKNVSFWTMIKRNLFGSLVYGSPILLAMGVGYAMAGSAFLDVLFDETSNTPGDPVVMIGVTIFLVGAFLTLCLYLISGIMVGVRNDKRSIHDLVAGTYVTYLAPGEKMGTEETEETTGDEVVWVSEEMEKTEEVVSDTDEEKEEK